MIYSDCSTCRVSDLVHKYIATIEGESAANDNALHAEDEAESKAYYRAAAKMRGSSDLFREGIKHVPCEFGYTCCKESLGLF